MKWEEVSNYRQMVDAATDSVLAAWGMLMRAGSRNVGRGYPSNSAGFGDGAGLADFEDLADEVEHRVGSVAMAIIYGDRGMGGLLEAYRSPLVAIYAGGAWVSEGQPEIQFLEAVEAFERKARGRGLL
jgi:hypothetical protein